MSNLLQVLPLAVVMVAGPQIISSFMLSTSSGARRNLVAYVGGAILGSVAVTSVVYLVTEATGTESAERSSSGSTTVEWVLVVVLALAAVKVFRGRHDTSVPKWMSGLLEATPRFCFLLGLALLSIFPSDLMINFTVGSFLSSHGSPLWHAVGFWGLTLLLIGIPLWGMLLLGSRAQEVLPKLRTWIEGNAWIVSLAVIGLFMALELKDIVSA